MRTLVFSCAATLVSVCSAPACGQGYGELELAPSWRPPAQNVAPAGFQQLVPAGSQPFSPHRFGALTPGYSPVQAVRYQPPSRPSAPPLPAGPSRPPATRPARPGPARPRSNPSRVSPLSSLRVPSRRRSSLARLSRTPDLFGDFNTVSLTQLGQTRFSDLVAAVPAGGAVRRFKNEQSRALPTDRFFFFYNHFHNALAVRSDSVTDRGDINQFTLGVEKTFGDGDWSVELRLPLAGESSLDNGFASARSDGVGNLAVTLRKLLYSDSEIALAAGLAVTAPTGSDADLTYFSNRVTIANDAVHLVPYLAIQAAPDDHWFFHGFAQFDVAANGDHITVTSPPISNPFVNTRRIVEQTLMYLDASVGHWWIRHTEPGTSGLTGLASVLELHYTTPLNDADLVRAGPLIVGNIDNRIDVVNLTMGLHSEWNHHTAVRFATVVPLRQSRENRFFDAEFQGTVIRRF